MAEREGRCPHCGNNLKVPEELNEFICMYCGARLTADSLEEKISEAQNDTLAELQKKLSELPADENADAIIGQIWDIDFYDKKANERYFMDHINDVIFKYEDAMGNFSRSEFVPYFKKYVIQCGPIVEAGDRLAAASGNDKKAVYRRAAEKLVRTIDEKVNSDETLKTKRKRVEKKDQYKCVYAIYLVPMVRELKLAGSEEFADVLVQTWCELNPKNKIGKGTFAEMVEGFKKGKLCFITTAACEYSGKPDDCYELTAFRGFRDSYMMNDPELKKLVNEYYEIAPAIVTCIDLSQDREKTYGAIWSDYLNPCLKALENGEKEECLARYAEMVNTLKGRFLN